MAVEDDEEAKKKVLEAEVKAGETLLQVQIFTLHMQGPTCETRFCIPSMHSFGVLTPTNDTVQRSKEDLRLFKVEVKALPTQPAHPLQQTEQVYLPMIRGKAGP